MTILVVEDDPLVLDVFESMLKSQGHDVMAAPDPATAATLLSECGKDPDLLLVDIVLAGTSGIDYASDLRKQYRSLAVLFTTGFASREAPALRTGLGEVLRKPFRPHELFEMVERAFRARPTS